MHKRTKALDIPKTVKDEVWERDGHQCIICGSPYAMPNAHYISRAHGGARRTGKHGDALLPLP